MLAIGASNDPPERFGERRISRYKMVRLLQRAFMGLALLASSQAGAADPVTFRRPGDDKNENSGVIRGVAFSPDGRLVAGAFGTFHGMLADPVPGQVVLWDVTTGRRRAALLGHGDGVKSVVFSPNGKLIATAGYLDGIKLWQTETLTQIASIPATAVISSIAFSPDGKFLVAGLDAFGVQPAAKNNAELYDVATRNLVRRFEGHDWGIEVVTFSPTGRLLATGSSDGTVRLWDVATGRFKTLVDQKLNDTVSDYWQRVARRKIEGMPPSMASVAFSPDGKRLAIAGGVMVARGREYGIGAVTLWDVLTRKLQNTLPGYACSVQQVSFPSTENSWRQRAATAMSGFGMQPHFDRWADFKVWPPSLSLPMGKRCFQRPAIQCLSFASSRT